MYTFFHERVLFLIIAIKTFIFVYHADMESRFYLGKTPFHLAHMPDSSTRTGPWIKWSLPLCQRLNMCMTLWDSILIQTCIKKRKIALQFCSAVVQDRDITVHKPHPLSSHACTWEGVLEKPTLFSIYK